MAKVQKIQTVPYERQGLIQFDGGPEHLEEWLEAVRDVAMVVEDGLLGWGGYKYVVRLPDVDGGRLYYLVETGDVIFYRKEVLWETR